MRAPVIEKGIKLIHHGSLPLLTLRIHLISRPSPSRILLRLPPAYLLSKLPLCEEISVPEKQLVGGVCGSPWARKAPSLLVSPPTPFLLGGSLYVPPTLLCDGLVGQLQTVAWSVDRPLAPLRRRRAGEGSHRTRLRSQALYELSLLLSTFF